MRAGHEANVVTSQLCNVHVDVMMIHVHVNVRLHTCVMQSQNSENVQRNLEIAKILRLRGR